MFEILVITLAVTFPSDSLRMESINGKACVVHQVAEKETLYSLSLRYGSTIPGILEQNPTADGGLEVGQILKIPYTQKAKGQPAVQTAEGLMHKVAAKETLFSIARMYNVSVDDIKLWNNLKENSLSQGQLIVIKRKEVIEPEMKIAQPTSAKTHTVAPKETMFSIARQYGMTVPQLKEWNNLSGSELKMGQVLSVVGPGALTTAIAPSAVLVRTTESSFKISESVSGTEEVKETGLAELIEGSEGNRKYLAQHRTIKPGTILKIRDLTTNLEVFVRITGTITPPDPSTIIRVSKSAYDRLGAKDPKFRAEITYYK